MGWTYQLGKGLDLHVGQVVLINGPHDKYGIVLSKRENGWYVIMGTGSTPKCVLPSYTKV